MSTQRHDDAGCATDHSAEKGARGELEPLASMLEYVQRLTAAEETLRTQLAELDREQYIVVGPGRIRDWHVDAIVIGPPGIFLIWALWADVERGLWPTAELCRQYFCADLGGHFQGSVEVVFASPSTRACEVQRAVAGPWESIAGFNVLFTQGNIAEVIMGWEPEGGLMRVSRAWIAELRTRAEPRWNVQGPDPRANPQPVMRMPERSTSIAGGW